MIERLSWYAFCAMFIGLGLIVTCWFGIFDRGDSRLLAGPGLIATGVAGIFMIRAMKKSEDNKTQVLAEAVRGQGTITLLEKAYHTSGHNTQGMYLTMTVQVPEREPFQTRVHMPVSHDVLKKLQVGLVLPVRIHPSNPDKVLMGVDQWLHALP